MSERQKVGQLGEDLVEMFLVKRGHAVLDRNFRRPWGELDIVTLRKGTVHFIEVKALARSVSDETKLSFQNSRRAREGKVSSETSQQRAEAYVRSRVQKDVFRPEESIGPEKVKRLGRIIRTYLREKYVSSETPWQFDVATVLIDEETKRAKINLVEELIL
jgi:Holliday junction resolvase-like predicted endonuclease